MWLDHNILEVASSTFLGEAELSTLQEMTQRQTPAGCRFPIIPKYVADSIS